MERYNLYALYEWPDDEVLVCCGTRHELLKDGCIKSESALDTAVCKRKTMTANGKKCIVHKWAMDDLERLEKEENGHKIHKANKNKKRKNRKGQKR